MTPEATRLADECKRLAQRAVVSAIHTALAAQSGLATEAKYDEDRRALDAAIEKLASMIPAGGLAEEARWQAIETAPKDLGARLYLVRGVCVQGFVDATGELCVNSDSKPWRRMVGKPTHWMPLPDVPAALSAPTPQQEQPR